MIQFNRWRKRRYLFLLVPALLLVFGCVWDRSYRSAEQKTIRDFSNRDSYRKTVGVMALSNTTIFTSPQIADPFMNSFLSEMKATSRNSILLAPDISEVPSFLWDPPRLPDGQLDVYDISKMARKEGMNAVVTPILMDIRVRKETTGFWFLREVTHRLQIQTACALYDAITGARLALKILTDEVDITQSQAETIRGGQEVQVDKLVAVATEMGEKLGEKMGDAVKKSLWQSSVVTIEKDLCIISAGSDAGVQVGDRFSVLDGSGVLNGLSDQRFTLPGPQIGEITIQQVTAQKAYGVSELGELPPVGSIVVPGR